MMMVEREKERGRAGDRFAVPWHVRACAQGCAPFFARAQAGRRHAPFPQPSHLTPPRFFFFSSQDRFTSLVPALTKYGSTTVGATLLAIGALGLYETWAEHTGTGEEEEDAAALAAVAAATPSPSSSSSAAKPPATLTTRAISGAWTLAAGIVYGLQPDALFVIIPALALPTRAAAGAYILTFVLGTVGAMGGYAAAIGATSRALIATSGADGGGGDGAAAARRRTARLSGAASLVALGVGCAVLASSWGVSWWPAALGGGGGAH